MGLFKKPQEGITKEEAEEIIQVLKDSKWKEINFTATAVNNALDICINLLRDKLKERG